MEGDALVTALSRLIAIGVVTVLCVVSLPNVAADASSLEVSRVWVEPQSGYEFLDAAIEHAHSSIDLSMYELSDATVESDLVAAARRHVTVRVILNSDYEGGSENAAAMSFLRAGSVQAIWAPSDQIFHAKYLVVDGSVAYVGTGNLVARDYPSTRDVWVSVTRPVDVAAIESTFNSDYARAPDVHQASGLVWSPGSAGALLGLIDGARHSLLVENEEMDSTPVEDALESASRRGVDVEVAMTKDSEWTSALESLTRAGVRVRLLDSSQVYVHAKLICADCADADGAVFIGSENFSTSSLDDNRELGVITTTPVVRATVRAVIDADFAHGSALVASNPLPSNGSVRITSLVRSVAPGAYEALSVATTRANQVCTLSVTLPSGYVSEASGLGRMTTDARGDATWSWRIGTSTDPGTATVSVACPSGDARGTFTIT